MLSILPSLIRKMLSIKKNERMKNVLRGEREKKNWQKGEKRDNSLIILLLFLIFSGPRLIIVIKLRPLLV